jgi:hypothetical protein
MATDGGGDAAVVVRDDELDSAEPPLAPLREQLRPALLALFRPEGSPPGAVDGR